MVVKIHKPPSGVTVKTLKVVGPGSSTIVAAPQEAHAECRFNVDTVLPSTANVYATYYSSCVPLIDALLDGKHSCLLIYGSSGSGKTSVLNGPPTGQVSGGSLSSGILPWIASELLRRLGELCTCELSHENAEIKVSLSAYEVCDNCVYDLMRPPDEPPKDLGFKSTGEGFEAVGAISRDRLKARAPHAGSGLFHIEISCLHPVLLGFTRFKEIGPERAIYCLV